MTTSELTTIDTSVQMLNRDLLVAARTLSKQEARFLVDAYYIIQDDRKRSASQEQALEKSGEPHVLLAWFFEQNRILENMLRKALTIYAENDSVARWAMSIYGIGPVISAGLLAHIDLSKAPTAGHIWNFAGLNPGIEWASKTKRPWNADLKTLCWKIGQSFMRFSNQPECYYGKLYQERKAIEIARNERGELANQAKSALERKNYSKDTEAYKAYIRGKLPPAHIDARARRWVVKLFLAHYHQVAFETMYGKKPPLPYAIEYLGHAHLLVPPNWG